MTEYMLRLAIDGMDEGLSSERAQGGSLSGPCMNSRVRLRDTRRG